MKKARCRIDVNLEELDRVLDGAREAPLSEADHDKLKDALHALAAMLVRGRNTEKTSEVLHPSDEDLSLGTPATRQTPLSDCLSLSSGGRIWGGRSLSFLRHGRSFLPM